MSLFLVACCRRTWDQFGDARIRGAIEVGERLADGRVGEKERREVEVAALDAWEEYTGDAGYSAELEFTVQLLSPKPLEAALTDSLGWRLSLLAYESEFAFDGIGAELQHDQCDFLRDIVGNPFRPASISPAWRPSTALALARRIYDEKSFDLCPILADALQDAGADDEQVLGHLRGGEVHCRGCWVVDGVLGLS